MTTTALRIDVADLLHQPGGRRELRRDVTVSDLAGSAARVDDPVVLDLSFERVPDGVVVRGTIGGRWHAQCSEGLEDLDVAFAIHVDELYEAEPVEGETYPLEDHELDLEQMVRDTVLLELPLAPVCEEGHADVRAALDADAPPPDPRWAPLDELDL